MTRAVQTSALAPPPVDGQPLCDLIELLFFAYRDFVGDADRRLDALGFGRAHHRVLHFVDRHAGLTVAELLDILRITKQSLNRVMKDLIDGGFISVETDENDRRRRLLRPTLKGCHLSHDIARLQSERLRRALDILPEAGRSHVSSFLRGMIDEAEQPFLPDLAARAPADLPDHSGSLQEQAA